MVATANLERTWSAAVDQLERQLPDTPSIDRCASIKVHPRTESVALEVILADGRATVRVVDDSEALVATAKALLTPLPVLDVASPRAAATLGPQKAEPVFVRRLKRRSVESGVAASSRLAASPMYVGYGLAAHIYAAVGDWLAGAWLRWNFQDRSVGHAVVPADLAMSSLLVGAMGGYRFALGRCKLDLTGGPSLVVENQEAFENTPYDAGGVLLTYNVGTGMRLLVPATRSMSYLGLVGGEVYPSRVGHTERGAPTLPPLPSWGLTFGVGVAWSVR